MHKSEQTSEQAKWAQGPNPKFCQVLSCIRPTNIFGTKQSIKHRKIMLCMIQLAIVTGFISV